MIKKDDVQYMKLFAFTKSYSLVRGCETGR